MSSEPARRRAYRERMNHRILEDGGKGIQRFFALDSASYREGALQPLTKELMGLVGSLVLRCDDCVFYHLDRCVELGASREQLREALQIGLVVGGSIVIPHLRRAWDSLDQLLAERDDQPLDPERAP
jgi:AhpD family alkylhydroperoxidase